MCKSLVVKVVFKEGLKKRDNFHATCLWEDDNLRPREFTLTVDSDLSSRQTLIALAHEMVHVKHYARGELRDCIRGTHPSKWLGAGIDPRAHDYWDLPWEKEAHEMETELYAKFKKHWKETRAGKAKPHSLRSSNFLVCKASSR